MSTKKGLSCGSILSLVAVEVPEGLPSRLRFPFPMRVQVAKEEARHAQAPAVPAALGGLSVWFRMNHFLYKNQMNLVYSGQGVVAGLLDSQECRGFLGILPGLFGRNNALMCYMRERIFQHHHAAQPPPKICYLVPICQEGAMGHLRINLNFGRKRSIHLNEQTFFIVNLRVFHIFV